MVARAATFDERTRDTRGRVTGASVGLLVAATALTAGALATVSATYAVALVIGVLLLVLVGTQIDTLPVFLVFTMFAESLALGPGVRVGRIAAALALIVVVLYVLQRGTRGLRFSALFAAALANGAWICTSALWVNSTSAFVGYFGRWVLAAIYMVTFAVLIRTKRELHIVFVSLGVGALIFGAVSFVGYVTQGSTYLAEGLGATGGASDHNYFAVYQVVALPAVLALTALERRRSRRVLWFAVVGVIVLSVVASLSRTGLLALGGAVLLTLVLPWRLFFRRRSQKMSYLFALVAAGAVVAASGSSPFLQRAQTIIKTDPVVGHAGSGRIDLWRAAWTGYQRHPILGLGAGGFPPLSVELLQATPGADASAAYARGGMVVHNMYLETLTEMGPVGELLLLGLLFLAGRAFLHAFRRSREAGDRELETISIALLISLVAYCIAGFFLSIEANKPLWILIGLALALDVMTRRLAAAPRADAAALAAAIPPRPRIYDPAVGDLDERERALAQRERRLEEQLQSLVAEREKLDRRGSLLELRQRRLEKLEQTHGAEPFAPPPTRADREQLIEELEAMRQRLAERERSLAERERLSEQRLHEQHEGLAAVQARLAAAQEELERRAEQADAEARELDERAARLDALEAALERPAAQPAPAPAPRATEIEAPAPVRAAQRPAAAAGAHTLQELERVIAEHADDPRVDEWHYYFVYLRDHADESGRLPANFDALVDEVFGELVGA